METPFHSLLLRVKMVETKATVSSTLREAAMKDETYLQFISFLHI